MSQRANIVADRSFLPAVALQSSGRRVDRVASTLLETLSNCYQRVLYEIYGGMSAIERSVLQIPELSGKLVALPTDLKPRVAADEASLLRQTIASLKGNPRVLHAVSEANRTAGGGLGKADEVAGYAVRLLLLARECDADILPWGTRVESLLAMVEGAEVEEGSEPLSGGAFLLRTKPCRFPFLPRIEIPGSTQYGILLADQPATAKGHPEPHVRKQWDVFISYRRLGDSETARLIRGELKARGFRAFLDVEDLGPRYFDEELLEHLDNSTGFIVILSPGSLDKRGASEDWLRREVARALAAQKRIVPIMKDDFQFPPAADLPDDLARLPRHNSVVYSHVHFGAVMDKIVKFLSAAPPRPR